MKLKTDLSCGECGHALGSLAEVESGVEQAVLRGRDGAR